MVDRDTSSSPDDSGEEGLVLLEVSRVSLGYARAHPEEFVVLPVPEVVA